MAADFELGLTDEDLAGEPSPNGSGHDGVPVDPSGQEVKRGNKNGDREDAA
jgi:hypothetical protein